MFNPAGDLTAIQGILIADASILSNLNLIGKAPVEIAERIIKRSQWSDLANDEKRLCIYFRPSRRTGSENLFQEVLQIDCHVPAVQDYIANQVIGRAVDLLNNISIKGRYLKYDGQLGELPTMPGFYCCGCRLNYFNSF